MKNYTVVTDDDRKLIKVINDSSTIFFQAEYDKDVNDMVVSRTTSLPYSSDEALRMLYIQIFCLMEGKLKWCHENNITIEETMGHNGNIVRVYKKDGVDERVDILSQYSLRPIKTILRKLKNTIIYFYDEKTFSPEKVISIDEKGKKSTYKLKTKGGNVNA
jgi:hypothetical protein